MGPVTIFWLRWSFGLFVAARVDFSLPAEQAGAMGDGSD
jgi:hypothetical protein